MVCRFYKRNKLNIPFNTLSFNVLFSAENKNLFKNLPKFMLITIYARTCLGELGKCRFLVAGFYC